jgi:hypothetical protein
MMQIMFPGLFDIPLIFINMISAYILAVSSYKLYKPSRLATDETIKLLFLGFFMLFSSTMLSLTSFFRRSIYFLIDGFVLNLSIYLWICPDPSEQALKDLCSTSFVPSNILLYIWRASSIYSFHDLGIKIQVLSHHNRLLALINFTFI